MAGTPLNLRGSIDLARWAGVVKGQNLPDYVRQENGERIQEAITFAAEKRKFLEVEYGNYEIDLPGGLIVPAQATGFTWIGHPGATIYQYANNTPIITVGATNLDSQKYVFEGVNLRYATDQAANTASVAMRLGNLWQSKFRNISVASTVWNPRCYTCFEIMQSNAFFQNVVEHCAFFRGARSLFRINALGTGNVFRDLYCSGSGPAGGSIATSITEPVWIEAAGGNAIFGGVFDQLNVEHCKANALVWINNARNLSFISTHVEGNTLTGNDPRVFHMVLAQASFMGLNLYNNKIKGTEGVTGTPAYFRSFHSSNIDITGLLLEIDTAADVDLDHFLMWQGDSPDNFDSLPAVFTVRNMNVVGGTSVSQMSIDRRLPKASFGNSFFESVEEIKSYAPMTRTKGMWFQPGNADFTLYGAHDAPYINYVTPLTAERSITLHNVVGPAATRGASVPIPPGRQCEVRRSAAATGAFNLLVKNHDGFTISTIAAAGTTIRYYYNGTNWVVGT